MRIGCTEPLHNLELGSIRSGELVSGLFEVGCSFGFLLVDVQLAECQGLLLSLSVQLGTGRLAGRSLGPVLSFYSLVQLSTQHPDWAMWQMVQPGVMGF